MSRWCKPNRRHFLKASLFAGGAALGGMGLMGRLARAGLDGVPSDRNYIFCYFRGGWDILLSLDPRDPSQFHAGNVGDTLILPGYELLDADDHIYEPFVTSSGMLVGPYIGDLADHDSKLAIVRGMSMETLTHEAGRRRFITGKAPSGLQARGSAASTWLAAGISGGEAIPNLSIQVESFNRDLPNSASALRVGNVPDLVRTLEVGPNQLGILEERQIDELLAQSAQCPSAQRSSLWQAAESSRLSAMATVEDDLASLVDFQGDGSGMSEVRDRYGIAASGGGALQTPEAQAATAVTAITSGISRVATIQVAGGLDTHYDDWTRDQGPTQERGFNAVARMVEDLESRSYGDGTTWLDHTTIIGFSEFARTALVNARGGRDHSLTGACFLIGGNIQGGQVIGASSDVAMGPTTTDLHTGMTSDAGEVINPEHVLRTLMYDAGYEEDEADFRVDPIWKLLA